MTKDFTTYEGVDGIPFRLHKDEQFPMVKTDDPEDMQPKLKADAKVKVFDLSKKADLEEYADVWNRAGKGVVLISAEERHWCETTQNFKVFLRWGDAYLAMPRKGEGLTNAKIFS